MRVRLLVTAESGQEASKAAERELYADKADVSAEDWKPVCTDFRSVFVHRAEDLAIPLQEKPS